MFDLRPDNPARRALLTRGCAAAGAALALTVPRVSPAASPTPCWDGDRFDALRTGFGHLRVVRYDDGGRPHAVPIYIASEGERSAIDLRTPRPSIRLGEGAGGVSIGPRGLSLKEGAEQRWSKKTVRRLIDLLLRDEALRQSLFDLRLAVHALYPEYLARGAAAAPAKLVRQRRQAAKAQSSFGRRGASGAACRVETVAETVTRTVTRSEEVILSAAEQFERCSDACYDRHLRGDRDDYVGYGLCEAGCVAAGFVDLVVGVIEVVETLTEEVMRQVVTCATRLPDGWFPHPFRGLQRLPDFLDGATPPAAGGATAFPADVALKAADILAKLVKTMPAAIRCVVEGDWSITSLRDLGLRIGGIEAVPVGVTVCMDRECALKLLGAGLGAEAVSIVSSLITLVTSGGVAAAVTAAGVVGAMAVTVTQAILVLLAVLIVLMIHLAIVAGQIAAYEALGLIDEGICITHPSLPVAAAGVVNPLLGMIALGNAPLIVTPRG